MYLCEKKIAYLSLYENKERTGSAGFVKISGEKEAVKISVHVTKAGEYLTGEYPLFLVTKKQEIFLGNFPLNCGKGEYERDIRKIQPEEICGVCVQLDENRQIRGEWQSREREDILTAANIAAATNEAIATNETAKTNEAAATNAVIKREAEEEKTEAEPAPSVILQEMYSGDKWEELLKQYKNVYPFGDDRLFISMEPKDFVILREPYQKLVNNSFLLHGFYNYRHVILGKDHKLGSSFETCFYLGVPGVFFEREKMVAVMFGFEGFECAGAVETGKFGYYMRQVEI